VTATCHFEIDEYYSKTLTVGGIELDFVRDECATKEEIPIWGTAIEHDYIIGMEYSEALGERFREIAGSCTGGYLCSPWWRAFYHSIRETCHDALDWHPLLKIAEENPSRNEWYCIKFKVRNHWDQYYKVCVMVLAQECSLLSADTCETYRNCYLHAHHEIVKTSDRLKPYGFYSHNSCKHTAYWNDELYHSTCTIVTPSELTAITGSPHFHESCIVSNWTPSETVNKYWWDFPDTSITYECVTGRFVSLYRFATKTCW